MTDAPRPVRKIAPPPNEPGYVEKTLAAAREAKKAATKEAARIRRNERNRKRAAKERRPRAATAARNTHRLNSTDEAGLTPMERRLVLAYTGECQFNAQEAKVAAGYSEKTSVSKIMAKPVVRKAIGDAIEERSRDLKITHRTVLAEAWRCYCLAVERGELNAAKGFLEMVGKNVDVQAFRTQVGVGNPDGTPFDFDVEKLSPDQREKVLAALDILDDLEFGPARGSPAGNSSIH